MLSLTETLLFTFSLVVSTSALNASCAPGGNFDLSVWELELPIGSSQGNPTTIPSSQLQGCGGYQDPGFEYFFTESGDGALVMKAPSPSNSDCIKYSGSEHCRTEFHEVNPATGSGAVSWSPAGSPNRLWVELLGSYGSDVCIGQVFQADGNPDHNKPLAEVYYQSNGDVSIGVEYEAVGGQGQNVTVITNVPVGTQFTYEVRYEENVLKMQVNNAGLVHLETYFTPSGVFFKAGNYNQGTAEADIHLFGLVVTH